MPQIQFREVENDGEWNDLVFSLPTYSFLLSSFRFNHEKSEGVDIFRYAIFEDSQFLGVMVGRTGKTKFFGKFLEFKHSPVLISENKEIWNEVLNFCKKCAIEKGCFMYRIAPLYQRHEVLENLYKEDAFVQAPIHGIDALISQYFDLSKSEEELRHDMTDSTRNNLNKLMKNDRVKVEVFNDESQFELFKDFYLQTEKIKGFVGKPIDTLLEELRIQVANNSCYMIVGYYGGKPVSIWQATHFGKYLHIYQAGSDVEFREKNVRMPYLLFWESVTLGKKLGCEILDLFGGMTPVGYTGKRHPWIGVNSFKESFGGKKVTYLHMRDFPIDSLIYRIYYLYASFRTFLKGYTIRW